MQVRGAHDRGVAATLSVDDLRTSVSVEERRRIWANRGSVTMFLLLGIVTGATAVLSLPLALGAVAVFIIAYTFIRLDVVGEAVAGGFWIAFGVYQTILSDAGVAIGGFFYPFYAALLASIVVALVRARLRMDTWFVSIYALFLIVVLGSFLGSDLVIGFDVFIRVFAHVFGFLILAQVGSRMGLRVIAVSAVICGTTVGGWIIVQSIQGGFAYRGDIAVDQNLAALIVGLGIVVALTILVWGTNGSIVERRWLTPLLWLAFAVALYGFLLLASRGLSIALGLSLMALVLRMVLIRPRSLLVFLFLLAFGSLTLLLPGGSGLFERFSSESVETGGNRLPAWEATLASYETGNFRQLLLGHGFDSSEQVVENRTGFTAVHNAYLQVLYEFGLLGLILFMALHVRLMLTTWRMESRIGTAGFAIVWLLLGANLSIDAPDGFMYWTAIGFVAALAAWNGRRTVLAEQSSAAGPV